MLTQTIILSATKYTVKPTVYMMQGDTGRVLACAFSDFTVPDGATARLYIHRPNGTFYTETATIDRQVVNVEADQVVTTAGYVNCDLEIEANNETVQSFPFTVRVLATEAGSPQTTEKGVSVAELDERVTALENAPQGAVWGEITGTLADQTDLKNALDGKLDGETSGTTESTFNGRLSHNTSDDSILMKSGDTGVGANLIARDGEITLGDDINVIRAREGYAADIGVKSGDTWTYSPIATEAYVADHSGISQADADERYLKLSGGTMSGAISTPNWTTGIANAQGVSFITAEASSVTSYIGHATRNTDTVVLCIGADSNVKVRRGGRMASSSNDKVALDTGNTEANPTLSGGETTLTSLKLNGTNYAVGGGSLYQHTINCYGGNYSSGCSFFCSVITKDSTPFTFDTFKAYLTSSGYTENWKDLPATGTYRETGQSNSVICAIHIQSTDLYVRSFNPASVASPVSLKVTTLGNSPSFVDVVVAI